MSSHAGHSTPMTSGTEKSSNGSASAAAAAAAKTRAKSMALSTMRNEQVSWYFAVAMFGLIAVFTISHWSRYLYSRYSSKSLRRSYIMRLQVAITRCEARLSSSELLFTKHLFRSVRHLLIRQISRGTSFGHIFLIIAYLGFNITFTVINMSWTSLTTIGKRCGWFVDQTFQNLENHANSLRMALLNMTFITLLSLKNTPLAYLTAYSYERLNPLHQIGGYTTVAYMFVHMVTLVQAFTIKHNIAFLLERDQIFGYVCGCSMFITFIAAIWFRRVRYELFYVTHIIMFLIIIIYLPLHIQHHAEKAVYISIFAASIWGADRLLRGSHLLWYVHGNRATITPLPNNGTRLVLSRSPSRAIPGNHIFVWIPKIRSIESHPFTIVSATETSLELVIAAYDGFTDDLHQYAVKNPGAVLRASVDGPYGSTPNFVKTADRVILIAGGSGASFTFGVALDMVKKLGESSQTTIDFVWSVKDHSKLLVVGCINIVFTNERQCHSNGIKITSLLFVHLLALSLTSTSAATLSLPNLTPIHL